MTLDEAYSSLDKIGQKIADWKKDPKHWTNNKRRLHGLCEFRGKLNDKSRFNPPTQKIIASNNGVEAISCIVEEEQKKYLSTFFENLVNIKDVQQGDKVTRASFKDGEGILSEQKYVSRSLL